MTNSPEADDSATTITVLGTAQRAAWARRVIPPVERLAGGLWSVPVPIPDNPLRYTLSYLVPGDHGLVVVDPGWETEEGWQALTAGLAAAGAAVGDVVGVVATHVHPDHHGLSRRLRAESGAWVAMHPAERDNLPQRIAQEPGMARLERVSRRMRSDGAPDEAIEELLAQLGESAPGLNDMAEPDVLLEDGDSVPLPGRRLHAIWTPGHTPGHLCLREPDAQLLLTGDHVLPRVTPNIGLHPERGDKPLRRFLESLDAVAAYDDHEAFPAHEYRFAGLAARVRQLHAHHAQRNAELLAVVDALGRPTVWELAERMSWARPWAEIGRMRIAALAETAAHADYLVDEGELIWERKEPDAVARLLRTA
jgi:glyoxylase-like metal-dependent hydrolase (beta-lactamase superfamily II)